MTYLVGLLVGYVVNVAAFAVVAYLSQTRRGPREVDTSEPWAALEVSALLVLWLLVPGMMVAVLVLFAKELEEDAF